MSWNSLMNTTAAMRPARGRDATTLSHDQARVCTKYEPATVRTPKFSPMKNSPNPRLARLIGGAT